MYIHKLAKLIFIHLICISHERNDQYFAFIVINRFEVTGLMKLGYPVYRV